MSQTPITTNARTMDLSGRRSHHSTSQKLARLLWHFVWLTVFRPTPRTMLKWRCWLLRRFGANLHRTARVLPSARVWAPWNLTMAECSTLGDHVDCYCVAPITLGAHSTVSQYSYLCAATHDHTHPRFPLVPRPITIGDSCWLAADVFVAPGVTIGDGTVVGARSSVFTDLPPWKVCVGSPARPIKDRVITDPDAPAAD